MEDVAVDHSTAIQHALEARPASAPTLRSSLADRWINFAEALFIYVVIYRGLQSSNDRDLACRERYEV